MKYIFRKATLDDLDAINNILSNEDFYLSKSDFEASELVNIFILVDRNIIGLIKYSILYERAELEYLYINNKYRGERLGLYLMEKMIDHCFDQPCINITLEVNIDNEVAISLYKKLGFNVMAVRKNYYHGKDALLMERKLV